MKTKDVNTSDLQQITSVLLNYADTFSFVVRDVSKLSEQGKELIKGLSIYLVNIVDTNSWPGTVLLDSTVKLYTYHFNEETALLLVHFEKVLSNWIEPNLPEDICFYKNDTPIFISITHESEAYIEGNDNDFIRLKELTS